LTKSTSEVAATKIAGIQPSIVNVSGDGGGYAISTAVRDRGTGRRLGGSPVVVVRVHTDEGITGIGEAYSAGPNLGVVEVLRDFESWLIGKDPREVERLWHLMYNGTRFPPGIVTGAAISGIEHALWDIKGKALGVPVWELLGGKCRERIRVYQAPGGSTPETMAENSVALVERYKFTALKLNPFPANAESLPWNETVKQVAARVEAVRKAVGDNVDIAVDIHAKLFEPIRAIEIAETLKQYKLFFLEEPIRPENVDALVGIKRAVNVPIATGENLYTRHQFRNLLIREAADYIQPDVCCTGGLLEMKKIASMAESFYVSVIPHNPCGPIATAVNVQFAACTQNFVILEYKADDEPPRRDLLQEPIRLVDGYAELPTAPGLGISLNEDFIERNQTEGWRRTLPVRPDGSLGYV
jgi:galactonate dehydratase